MSWCVVPKLKINGLFCRKITLVKQDLGKSAAVFLTGTRNFIFFCLSLSCLLHHLYIIAWYFSIVKIPSFSSCKICLEFFNLLWLLKRILFGSQQIGIWRRTWHSPWIQLWKWLNCTPRCPLLRLLSGDTMVNNISVFFSVTLKCKKASSLYLFTLWSECDFITLNLIFPA